MIPSNNTMERIVPDELSGGFGLASLNLHYERYQFAAGNIRPGRILDIACGTGYGTYLLATQTGEAIQEITGVDVSASGISYARERYAHPKIKYIEHDALTFYDENKFHSIISLETIEHLNNPAAFISRLYDLLHPGGVLIASVPVTPSTDINPYHISNFSEKSFRKLFLPFALTPKDALHQTQKISVKDILDRKKNERTEGMRKNIIAFYISHPNILFARAASFLKDGFSNKYTTVVLQKIQ